MLKNLTAITYLTSTAVFLLFCSLLSSIGWGACDYKDTEFLKVHEYNLIGNDPDEPPVPHVLIANDYNGDSLIDLVALSRSYVEVTILFGNGDGTFQMPPARYPLRMGTAARNAFHECLCDGDFDGDGDIDLAAVDWIRNEMCILFNDGNGVFSDPVIYYTFDGAHPHGVVGRDIDNDGDLDLIVTNDLANSFSLYENDGTGVFTMIWTTSTHGIRPQNVGVGDFDGDGDYDYAAANSGWDGHGGESTVAVFNNDSVDGPLGIPSYQGDLSDVPDQSSPVSAIVNDLDEDGNLDLLIGAWLKGVLCIFWGDGDGGFSAADHYVTEGTAVQPDIADFNKDGIKDIVICLFEAPKVQILWGRGNREFSYGPLLEVASSSGTKPRFPALGDFDRDGDIDFATVQYGAGTIVIFENQCSSGQTFRRGDVNADGESDLSDAISILIFLFGQGAAPSCRDSADVNDDSSLDMADVITLLGYMFAASESPPAPFSVCGIDTTEDDLGCESFEPCD